MNELTMRNQAFFRLIQHPVKFRLFLLRNLPAAYFSRVRLKGVTAESCAVTVPFGWFTQNPFRSTYFACLSMAAEMSTGILAMGAVYKRPRPVSMLIIRSEAVYHKKARSVTTFTCRDGKAILEAVEQAVQSGRPASVTCISEGLNEAGEAVATFSFTWSFKARGHITS